MCIEKIFYLKIANLGVIITLKTYFLINQNLIDHL